MFRNLQSATWDIVNICKWMGRNKIANLFWPTFDRKRPQARREPSIKYIFILLEGKRLPTRQLFPALRSLFMCSSDNPVLTIRRLFQISSATCHRRGSENTHIRSLSFNHDKVSGAPVTPPQLPGDAPVLDAAQPRIPFGFGRLRVDFEFAFSCSLRGVTQASK